VDAIEMDEPAKPTVNYVIGLDGRHLTIADLPTSDTKRWVIRRKAEVIAAVRGGLLSREEAFSRYALNSEEFLSWQNCIERFGLAGLRATGIQSHLRPVSGHTMAAPTET
jgi:hypothetical protein